MVLTRRQGMRCFVLGLVLGILLLGGCRESLFGAHPLGGGPAGDDAGDDTGSDPVPTTCGDSCIADAAANFDGTATGLGGHWRYLEDLRNRTWTAMTPSSSGMTGKIDQRNRITTCAANPGAAACQGLPGALLVSSAGGTSAADPALELTVTTSQVIQLSLHVFVPGGAADQTVRLYRNSREDVLFTGTAAVGNVLRHAITLDALAGDRFLIAVTPVLPMGSGATEVGLHLFASGTGTAFPSDCQLAVPFESTLNGQTKDSCTTAIFQQEVYTPPSGTPASTMKLVNLGPFPMQGNAVDLTSGNFIVGELSHVLDWSKDLTVQFWVQLRSIPSGSVQAMIFSDLDRDIGGGVAIYIVPDFFGGPGLSVEAATHNLPLGIDNITTPYPSNGSWQFVRVVRSGGAVDVCLDGTWVTSLPVRRDQTFTTSNSPSFGRDVAPNVDAYFDGHIDDVRAITGALPCDP